MTRFGAQLAVLALASTVLAGCSFGPEFYAEPPANPDLPQGQGLQAISLLLTTDRTNQAIRGQGPPVPAGGEPRDMDIEVLITSRLGDLVDVINFTRDAVPVDLPDRTGVRLVADHFQYGEMGRDETQTDGWLKRSAPRQLSGSEYREWSHVYLNETGWKLRIRVRFRSEHSMWEFSDSALVVRFKDGRTQTVPLFDKP